GVDDIRAQRIAPFDAVPYVLPVGDPLVAPQPPPGGLNELKAQLEVKPNPVHGALRIEFALFRSEPATLDVFDLVGRRVAHRELAASSGARSITLDEGASLAPGLYLVKLTQGDLQIARRAIVAR
ncbi:MAG TPA: T9SS type A sorting domain-containing protein, partial [Candidatus Sulfotelmatobacter sp.]|nr:T9SS type A sorting domain-containing protein [Candidatus Sulfotelmatobacter sp.]